MSILSDKEIIERCATTTPMIAPFCMEQVRQTKTPHEGDLFQDGTKRVISYGLSSYGYDVRCADEFKVFTNINSTIVDPKNFDEQSFIEMSGKGYCIIPPNSFALGRTVERFNIPRDILTVCLGKSTYARCFTGDTMVALADGTFASFFELIERDKKGEKLKGISVSQNGTIVVSNLTAPRKIGHEKVVEVSFATAGTIRCTPDHKFLMENLSLVEAKDLKKESKLFLLDNDEESQYSHMVYNVRELPDSEDVYCLTVPERGNFALANGVFVKNCGIIVNVTPFEPEWAGYVTLEFSNTTPLPAKIYANEGVAQVLFFKADQNCLTSYKDRGGKYQDQTGVTTARV